MSTVVAVNDTPPGSRLVDATSGISGVVVVAGVVFKERVVVVAPDVVGIVVSLTVSSASAPKKLLVVVSGECVFIIGVFVNAI